MAKRNGLYADKELERMYVEVRRSMRLSDKEIASMLRKTRKSFKFA